jgi:hypothetical protein
MNGSLLPLIRKPRAWLYAFGCIAFWIWLATLGFPGPRSIDDVFHGGAAVHWAKTGVLENPWVGDWLRVNGLLEHRFYIYPPLHFFVLGTWARVFGVSALSFQAFQICCLASSSLLAAIFFLRTETRIFALAAPFVLTAYLWDDGVRAETTAVILLLGGCVLLLWRSRWIWVVAGLLLAGTCCASPVLGSYAVAIFVTMTCVALPSWRARSAVPRESYYYLLAGFAIISMIFVAALNQQLPPFLRDLFHHGQMTSSGSMMRNVLSYGIMLSFGVQWLKIPLIVTALFLPAFALWSRHEPGVIGGIARPLSVALFLGTCVLVLAQICLGHRLETIELVSVLIIGLSLSNRAFANRKRLIQIVVCGMIVAAKIMLPLEALTHNRPDKAEVDRVLEDLNKTPHEKIFADDYAMWWLFDWAPPENFSSYRFSYHHDVTKAQTLLEDDEVWIIPQSEIDPQPLRLLGHTFHSLPVNRNVFVILDSSAERKHLADEERVK